jgi:hypothetical protein
VEADTAAAAEIRSRLCELATIKGRRERELELAERALGARADPERARQLVDSPPRLDVDAALLAERSFRELLAALDFAASFSPDQKELRVRACLVTRIRLGESRRDVGTFVGAPGRSVCN